MNKKPKAAVRDAIKAAKPAEVAGDEEASRKSGQEGRLKKFKMLETGLHCLVDDELKWICAPFAIDSETIDEAGAWGVLLSWRNRDGDPQSEIFDRAALAGDCRDVRIRLAAGGLTQAGDDVSRKKLVEYLNLIKSNRRARCVSATGWHILPINGSARRVFVLPEKLIGADQNSIILQGARRDRAPFNAKGTLAEWRESVGRMSYRNSRLMFCLSTAFAGPLLELIGEDGGGFNLRGPSRIGKSTALRVAASVWGGDALSGAAGFVRNWRSTGNGLEAVAAQYSDTLLPLDEMGQVDAREIGDIAYMLANGTGKSRAGRDGGARAPARWRVLFLSTGEVGLSDKNVEAKLNTKSGQQMRLIDIVADPGKGLGLYEFLHDESSSEKFVEILRNACRQNYGVAGVAFVNGVVGNFEKNSDFALIIKARIEDVATAWLKGYDGASGQVYAVARRFASVAVAGDIASEWGITGWPKNAAVEALYEIFQSWLNERGSTASNEELMAKKQLAAFISRHGSARFETWMKPLMRLNDDGQLEQDETPIASNKPIQNRAGWRRVAEIDGKQSFQFYLTDDAMAEALAGLDIRPAVKSLADSGFILRDSSGKNKVSCEPPGVGKTIRIYLVPSHIIGFSQLE